MATNTKKTGVAAEPEVKQEVQNEPAEVKETPANKSAAEVETEVTPESIKKSVNDISDAEILFTQPRRPSAATTFPAHNEYSHRNRS